jgi:hypothetical protein
MAKTKISEFSSTASNNTDIDGISVAEGMAPSNVNNAFRELMSQLKDWQSGAVSQDMSVNGVLTVSGNTVLSANLTATGTATISGVTNLTASPATSSGTYGRAGTTITVSSSSHGFSNGQVLYLFFSAGTGGTATSSAYTISNVSTNTFDVTDTVSGSISGSPSVTITRGGFTCNGAVVRSSLSVGGPMNVGGDATLNGAATISGATVLSSTLAANGNITMGNTTTNAHILNGSLTATTSSVIYLDDSVTTASAPVLSWDGDTNTGFFRPAADTIAIATGGTERVRIDSTGNLTATGSVGYPTGSGGAVTQITSKSTGVTLNTICGQITTHNASLGSSVEVSFTLTNSKIAATDVVVVCIASGATTNTYSITVDAVAAGSCRILLRNVSGTSRSEALVINFAVIKSVAA